MKKTLSIFAFFTLIFFAAQRFADAGWLFNWNYRKPVIISNSGAGALSDYQVSVTTDTAILISAGGMQATGADIRFTKADGTTELPYWIESGINTASTKIWVKVFGANIIPASGSYTIYMFYGNPSAAGISNYGTVFSSATGGTITYGTDYTTHTFTSAGTFTPFFTGNVDITVLGGGGGSQGSYVSGCGCNGGPGGGSGGINIASGVGVTNNNGVSVTVGAGGGGSCVACSVNPPGGNGGASSFGAYTATGGPGSSTSGGTPGGFGGGNVGGCDSNGGGGGGGGGTSGAGSGYSGGSGGGGNGYGGAGGAGNNNSAKDGGIGAGGGHGISGACGGNGGNGIVVVKYLHRSIASPEPTTSAGAAEFGSAFFLLIE